MADSNAATPWGPGNGTQPCRPVLRIHTFGKGEQAMRRDPHIPPTMRGWLHKQDSSGLRLWKRRWFVLVDLCLYYYRAASSEYGGGSPYLATGSASWPPTLAALASSSRSSTPGCGATCWGLTALRSWGPGCAVCGTLPHPWGALPSTPAPEETPPHGLQQSVATTNQQLTPPAAGGLRDAKEGTVANQESAFPRETSDWLLASGGTAAQAAANEISLWPWEQSIVGSRGLEDGREGVANGSARQPIRITLLHASF
ncbi:uncharacterized protein LOC122188132 isoform X3 [Lagopus leucura]|uniref:uncharacterized protein LOC122188132 isoform X3 n=1 Tax=Lagopus leucura TaxID=30410 RepID=UPI001C664127|nr:uncharacterized protein LOC122188132 isoform X3 [Lagopus leucura]